METLTDADEILSKLKEHRKNILLLLYRHGELRTREIREQTRIPRGSKDHHFDVLEGWGLIEVVGKSTQSGGIPERVFSLTDQGREFVDDHLTDDEERPDSYEMRLDRAEDEIDQLQQTVDHLESTVDQQRQRIGELEDSTVSEDRFEELVEKLNGEYVDKVVAEVKKQIDD